MRLLVIFCLLGQLAYRPHASETSKPAVFGYMILARSAEQAGTSVGSVYAQSVLPYLACLLLGPYYFYLARRSKC